jgi:hypothetical protein
MKKIKVFWNGEKLKEIYPYATKWEVFKFRAKSILKRIFWLAVLIGVIYGVAVSYRYCNPRVVQVITEKNMEFPVLDRIAKCESGNNQLAKNGQVVVHVNKNGSVDVGAMQINLSVWGQKATDLGYNLMVGKDNRAFALFIYQNYGTDSWSSSENCWNK